MGGGPFRYAKPTGKNASAMTKSLDQLPADFDENPEWTEADFARARPFKEMFPEEYEAWKAERASLPPVAQPKLHIGFRLAADVVGGIRATGRGYNQRVEKLLREALAKGEL